MLPSPSSLKVSFPDFFLSVVFFCLTWDVAQCQTYFKLLEIQGYGLISTESGLVIADSPKIHLSSHLLCWTTVNMEIRGGW